MEFKRNLQNQTYITRKKLERKSAHLKNQSLNRSRQNKLKPLNTSSTQCKETEKSYKKQILQDYSSFVDDSTAKSNLISFF